MVGGGGREGGFFGGFFFFFLGGEICIGKWVHVNRKLHASSNNYKSRSSQLQRQTMSLVRLVTYQLLLSIMCTRYGKRDGGGGLFALGMDK